MSTYFDKILKEFKMDQSKEFLPVLQGVKLSKTQSPTTAENRKKRMKVIPYATVIGSIKYVVLCTRPIMYLAMSVGKGVQ